MYQPPADDSEQMPETTPFMAAGSTHGTQQFLHLIYLSLSFPPLNDMVENPYLSSFWEWFVFSTHITTT